MARGRRRGVVSAAPIIDVRGVRRSFRVRQGLFAAPRHVAAIDGVSFSVGAGEVLGIVGESGCGKSTLARVILGLLPPTAGEVLVDGQRVADMDRRARARLIQPVFQDPFSSLNPRRRVRDVVSMPLDAQGDVPAAEARRRVDEMLARVGLDPSMGERYPAELSGGQRQRVAIARALANDPVLILADEPTGNLDSASARLVFDVFASLAAEEGRAVVVVTHDEELARRATRRLRMVDGAIVPSGAPPAGTGAAGA
jgi:peptide/nickel transport system ATP-binding protein